MTADTPSDDQRTGQAEPVGEGCALWLSRLARGELRGWSALPRRCPRAEVDAVLTQTTTETNDSHPYSGPLDYAATPGAPRGLTVHYAQGAVEYIVVPAPAIASPVRETLGEPEVTLPSLLEGSTEQWAYPGLGVAWHVTGDGRPSWLYAFPPMSARDYLDGSLSQVRTLRHQRRVVP
jgi:hypothetical protein